MNWTSGCGRLELSMTLTQAQSASHTGQCDDDVKALLKNSAIRRQVDNWGASLLASVLGEYGGWEYEELQNHETNIERMVWLAAGDIVEENA